MENLVIIDANSILHRAFHALPSLTTKKGELVNAVYGFLLVFLRVIRELKPDYLVACFDFPGITFRHKEYKEYKAKRPPMPENLASQIPKIKDILKVFGVPILEKEGFEADDIIASLKFKNQKSKINIIIVSGDSDLLSLVDKNTKVYLLKSGVKDIVLYDENLVKEKYQGLNPSQLVDFKALKGDPSDNVPGVPGIGEKTALDLIKEFKSIENLYTQLEKQKDKLKINKKTLEKLKKGKELAFLSKLLISLKKDAEIDFALENFSKKEYNKKEVIETLKHFEFYSLIKRIDGTQEKKLKKEKKNKENIINKTLF